MKADDAISVPRSVRARLRAVAAQHRLGTPAQAALHFVDRGLDRYGAPDGPRAGRLTWAVEAQGYSSLAELVEHLLLRGLSAYEEPSGSPEELAARLRGLGYID